MTRSVSANSYGLSQTQLADFKALAATLMASGQLSARIKRPEDAVVIMAKGIEVGLPPMEALKQIYCIGGIAAMQSDGMRSLLLRSGCVQIIDVEHTRDRCVLRMIRRHKPGGEVIAEYTAEWDMAKATLAGLTGKAGPWKQYPDIMLRHRATGEAARAVAADIIGGMYVPEDFNVTRLEDLTPEVVASYMQEVGIGKERAGEIKQQIDALSAAGAVQKDDCLNVLNDLMFNARKNKAYDMTEEELEPLTRWLDKLEAECPQAATGSDISDVDAQTDTLPAEAQTELNLEDK